MLRPAEETFVASVEATLIELDLAGADTALVRLTRELAATLDAGDELADHVERAWEALNPEDIDGRKRLALIEAKLTQRATLSDLGPKLLAALTALGATPAARAQRRGGGGDRRGPSGLDALRQARRGA